MSLTAKKILVAVLVLIAALAAIVYMNVPAEGTDPRERNEPTEFEGGTIELARSIQPSSTTEQRHRVKTWKGGSENLPLAAPGCKKILTFDRGLNSYGNVLFSIQVRATWCWRDGRLTLVEFDRDYNVGDDWWNLYKLREWKQPVRTERPKYAYNRQGAIFEACAGGSLGCFIDTDAWLSQTVRRGGSYDTDWKR